MHLEESDDEINVANLTETANIQTDQQQGVLSTEFTSGSFSAFTITWKTSNSIKFYYYRQDTKTQITGPNSSIDSDAETTEFNKEFAGNIPGYEFVEARYGSQDGTAVSYVVAKTTETDNSNSSNNWWPSFWGSSTSSTTTTFTFYDADDNSLSDGTDVSSATVYLIYRKLETVDTISKGIAINLFDYIVNDSSTKETEDNFDSGINNNHALKFLSQTQTSGLALQNSWRKYKDDGQGAIQGIVKSTLQGTDGKYSVSGFPVLGTWAGSSSESLSYLFDSSPINAKAYYPNCTKLFTLDSDGYYSYSSGISGISTSSTSGNFASIADSIAAGAKGTKEDPYVFTVYEDTAPNSLLATGFFPFTSYSNATTWGYGTDAGYSSGYGGDSLGSSNVNHYFGMTITTDFVQPQNGELNGNAMAFSFTGDDDVWVYIDGVLVLDIGGIHDAVTGTIDFSNGAVTISKVAQDNGDGTVTNDYSYSSRLEELFQKAAAEDSSFAFDFDDVFVKNDDGTYRFKDYSKHTLSFFYLERGANTSTCEIKFNLPTVPAGSLVAGKTVSGLESGDASTYEFTLVDKTSGEAAAGQSYKLYGGENPSSGTEKETGTNGEFTLKDGEYAVFENLTTKDVYTVTETGISNSAYTLEQFYTYATYYDANGELFSNLQKSADLTISAASSVSVSFLNAKIPEKDLPLEKSKYVKDNGNGTYDLTLEKQQSGQIRMKRRSTRTL
jgi:fibro-slime domain-containing protein